MYGYIFFGFSCLCTLVSGGHAEGCSQTVLAKRQTIQVPLGGEVQLSCDVQHCGENEWTWMWMWTQSSSNMSNTQMVSSLRHHLTNLSLSANTTRLGLRIQDVHDSDEGAYGCNAYWKSGGSALGHRSSVKLTDPARASERRMPHRVLVWGAALLCVVLLLLAARCLSSQPKHAQTRGASRHRQVLGRLPQAPQYPDPDREVLYSDVLHGAWSKPGAAREPPQPTVYSTLRYGEEA